VELEEIYKRGQKATLENEPLISGIDTSYARSMYYVDLWRDWYANLSDVLRHDYMFQELPEKFRTTNNTLCQSALEYFDEDFARKRWNIIDPPSLEEVKKDNEKNNFTKPVKKVKVSKKAVDNNSITAAQAFAEINSLVDELEYHEKKYYEDNDPEISDYDFDMKLKRLEELEKQFPEFKQSESPTERVGRGDLK
jgi:hypothetical protein